jgi:hypothetical protein
MVSLPGCKSVFFWVGEAMMAAGTGHVGTRTGFSFGLFKFISGAGASILQQRVLPPKGLLLELVVFQGGIIQGGCGGKQDRLGGPDC